MPAIKSSCVNDLKLRANIVDVISRVVTLRKAGSRFRGLCPFHNEKTPSFNVDAEKGFYKCFGCGKAGDIITFVRETEQLNFTEAVEALGKRFGVVIEYEAGSGGPSREDRSLRQEIFDLHDAAAEHFYQAFKAKDAAGDFMRTYWVEKRRFPLELADEFKIGVADEHGSGLGAALLKRKFSDEALRRCGLFFTRDDAVLTIGALKPRFRGRLMIPIRDHQGRVVAFTARQTDLTPADDPAREAKYINSPETPIFTKGNLLFNLDRARTAVGEGRPFVLVEGQLDALRCWSVGLKTAIAPQGTSITESQLVLLRRYSPQVECFFDSDSAGQKAALRLLPMALQAGIEVRLLTRADANKLDPDLLFLERGLAAYEDLKRGALSMVDFMQRYILPNPASATLEATGHAVQQIYQLVSVAESKLMQRQLLSSIAPAVSACRIPPDVFEQDYVRYIRNKGRGTLAADPAKPPPPSARDITPETHLLLLCLHCEELGKPLSVALPHEWIDIAHPPGVLLNRFLSEFEANTWPGRDHLDPLLETPEERTLVASLLFETPVIEDPVKNANEGLRKLRARALEPRLRQIELDLATHHAESKLDPISLLKEHTELQKQLRQPLGLVAAL
ncbi:MAG: DNA primase [Opitutaceae bacterium]|nr:DNA primase [Opitutaceae bacterium]